MRRLAALALAGLVALSGCSLVTLDFQPRIRPLEEETVEGKGTSKILLLDLSGVLSEDVPSFSIDHAAAARAAAGPRARGAAEGARTTSA